VREEAKRLVLKLLDKDPDKRARLEEVLIS